MIHTINLTKKFGREIAVNNLNLDIKRGELFGFLGPNGAGKTTTIKLLAGLLKPSSGLVFVCGYNVQKDYISARTRMGYIPDIPYLYERLTGREFLRFVSEIYFMGHNEAEKRIEELLDFFEMRSYGDILIEEYSHGMRQKIVMCATMLHNPEVILVDEPMVGLDPKTSRLVKDMFRENAHRGVTIFMSTHTLSLAEEICDRIAIIDKANLVAIGTIDELKKISGIDGRLEEIFLSIT